MKPVYVLNNKKQKIKIIIKNPDFFNDCFIAHAYKGFTPIGFCMFYIYESKNLEKLCYIDNICVYEPYRKIGNGKQLLSFVEMLARKRDCKKIVGRFLPYVDKSYARKFYTGNENYITGQSKCHGSKFDIIFDKGGEYIVKELKCDNVSKPNFMPLKRLTGNLL